MIVGFEVVACSIERQAGQPIQNIPCPQTPDEPNAPKPQEVTKGEARTPLGQRGRPAAGRARTAGSPWRPRPRCSKTRCGICC